MRFRASRFERCLMTPLVVVMHSTARTSHLGNSYQGFLSIQAFEPTFTATSQQSDTFLSRSLRILEATVIGDC